MDAQAPSPAFTETETNTSAPIEIICTRDLNFGEIVRSGTAGTVTINAVSGARTASGGVYLGANGGASAAAFEITGQKNKQFTISLSNSITISNGTSNMTVNAFTTSLTGNAGKFDHDGQGSFQVGARLNVSAQQATGVYKGTFEVTIAL